MQKLLVISFYKVTFGALDLKINGIYVGVLDVGTYRPSFNSIGSAVDVLFAIVFLER